MRISAIFVIGLVTGIMSGLLGVGGGIVMVPAMVYLLGLNQHRAHGTSLAVISLISLVGAVKYAQHGHVNWVIAFELAVGGVLGASVGARTCSMLSARRLRRYFGIFLCLVGIRMLYDVAAVMAAESVPRLDGYMLAPNHLGGGLIIVAIGLLSGILSGLLGVGGGIILVPALVLGLHLSQTMAQGISLAVIIPVSISGTLIHRKRDNVRSDIAMWLAAGGIIGGLLGAQIAVGLNPLMLRAFFGLLVLSMGILTIMRKSPAAQRCEV